MYVCIYVCVHACIIVYIYIYNNIHICVYVIGCLARDGPRRHGLCSAVVCRVCPAAYDDSVDDSVVKNAVARCGDAWQSGVQCLYHMMDAMHIRAYKHTCVLPVCMHTHMCTCVDVCVHAHVCMYLCMYMYIHVHIFGIIQARIERASYTRHAYTCIGQRRATHTDARKHTHDLSYAFSHTHTHTQVRLPLLARSLARLLS